MANQDLKVTLEVNRSAVIAGGEVQLTAKLSKPVGELKKQGISIKFNAPDDGQIVVDPLDPTKATWRAVKRPAHKTPLDTKAYTVKVKLKAAGKDATDAAGNPIEDKKKISVLKDPSIRITMIKPTPVSEGGLITVEAAPSATGAGVPTLQNLNIRVDWDTSDKGVVTPDVPPSLKALWDTTGLVPAIYTVKARLIDQSGVILTDLSGDPIEDEGTAEVEVRPLSRGDTLPVTLRRSVVPRTRDQALWVAIRNRTKAISFSGSGYKDFIDRVLCKRPEGGVPGHKVLARQLDELGDHVYGVGGYELLKTATQVFLLLECGVVIKEKDALNADELFKADEETGRLGEPVTFGEISDRLTQYLGTTSQLPYIKRILRTAFPDEDETTRVHCFGVLSSRVQRPCLLELIWSYWHEEGMLVQTLGAISRRFQNVRGPGERDPLAHLEIDPLRPLNNLLWGYIQDEQNRLTLKRRAYEYDHHYGLTLYGKAVPTLRPADSRSKFLEGFHNLLHLCSVFYKEDNDTTVIADGFPLLNALKEVHLLLAQGAHNQFGDLPWTARAEMLVQEWLLARPEIRDFMQSRPMVPYKEGWMPQVDTMKTMQGWSDVTVTHFRDLGVYGEQILLSIRYGDWIDLNDEDSAKNWARYWRPEIQGYLHAYRAATGVDLTNPDTVDYAMPAVHLQKRLATQRVR